MTRCTDCGVSKTVLHFGFQVRKPGKSQVRSQCKACRSEIEKARYKKQTPEQRLMARDRFYKRTYGIGIDEYNRMFAAQEGRCLGCKRHQSEFKKTLAVDHCHKTGKVRALLCVGCNIIIGLVKEDPEMLKRLVAHLEESSQ